MMANAIHYSASEEPLNTPLTDQMEHSPCPKVSAGHKKHEYTTGCAWPKIKVQFENTL